jgi:hypothetical protein
MSTLDEITKEKQRVGKALARVDAQREKLIGQLGELEAAERVLARYGEGTAPAQSRRRSRTATTKTAGGQRNSLTLSDQVLVLATGKTQKEIAAACKGARPEPCRLRDCPAQAGWPPRRARREALRRTIDRPGAARRGLTTE